MRLPEYAIHDAGLPVIGQRDLAALYFLTKRDGERMSRVARGSLSEKQMGYLLIAPALVIILIIAIWPVVRSFWISLYDIRLNDPTKNEIHRAYGLDMERYVSTLPNLLRYLNREAGTAEGAARQQLLGIKQEIEQMRDSLNQVGGIATQ